MASRFEVACRPWLKNRDLAPFYAVQGRNDDSNGFSQNYVLGSLF